jgi:hypothetical protein
MRLDLFVWRSQTKAEPPDPYCQAVGPIDIPSPPPLQLATIFRVVPHTSFVRVIRFACPRLASLNGRTVQMEGHGRLASGVANLVVALSILNKDDAIFLNSNVLVTNQGVI